MKKGFVGVYAGLLACLPPGFRDEFSEEMEQVFAGRMQEAGLRRHSAMVRLFLIELLAFPRLWLLAYQRDRRVIKVNDPRTITSTDGRASWGATLVAVLPLAGFIAAIFLSANLPVLLFSKVNLEFLNRFLWKDVLRVSTEPPWIFYLGILAGFLVAWVKGFPRWSYSYLGWLATILLFSIGTLIPGDPYFKLSWGPFLLTLLLAILLTRSLKPVKALWHDWRRDWTLVSFFLFAQLQFWVLVFFDEMPDPKGVKAFWIVCTQALIVIGALWYMRASGKAGRIAALLGSAMLSMALSFGVSAYYWHNYPKSYGPLISGYGILVSGLVVMGVVVVFLLAPALFSAALNRLFHNHSTG